MDELHSENPMIKAAAYFAALSDQLHSEHEETNTLERICEQAMEVVPTAQYCSITLRRRRGVLETVVATDQIVEQGDALQYELDEGPCVDAARDAGTFLVRDTATDERWPNWGPRAAELGLRSLIGVQLTAPRQSDGDTPLGAINLYDSRIGTFTVEDRDRALIFAYHAAGALASAQKISGLETAVQSRHVIGVAQGILMQRYGLSLDRSFDALRRYSSEANIKLRDLAQMVVDNGSLPSNAHPERH